MVRTLLISILWLNTFSLGKYSLVHFQHCCRIFKLSIEIKKIEIWFMYSDIICYRYIM